MMTHKQIWDPSKTSTDQEKWWGRREVSNDDWKESEEEEQQYDWGVWLQSRKPTSWLRLRLSCSGQGGCGGTYHQVNHLPLLGLEGGSCGLVRHTVTIHCPICTVQWIQCYLPSFPEGRKFTEIPWWVWESNHLSKGLSKALHSCFDLRMSLATALSWLHCILSTPLVMSIHISPPLKYGPFQILSSFPKCFFFPLFLNRCSVWVECFLIINSESNVRPSPAHKAVLSP